MRPLARKRVQDCGGHDSPPIRHGVHRMKPRIEGEVAPSSDGARPLFAALEGTLLLLLA